MSQDYFSKLKAADKGRGRGISDVTIQTLMEKAGLNPLFFFDKDVTKDDLKFDEASGRVLYIAKARENRRLSSIEQELATLREEMAEMRESRHAPPADRTAQKPTRRKKLRSA